MGTHTLLRPEKIKKAFRHRNKEPIPRNSEKFKICSDDFEMPFELHWKKLYDFCSSTFWMTSAEMTIRPEEHFTFVIENIDFDRETD
ncbi:hypothetical protein AYI68_g3526 [Smittium mucronatum]|uniref:Uncharacterized protein n=1 Tax=Smittium mucronatum TaxID=133383 RepID=A0A1R0GZL7_9FUNG|nr:hypothetical protein AYI68_g3526 [Smittium mucronatum]